MNKNLRNVTFVLLISLIPLLTACTLMDNVKGLFSKTTPEAAKDSQLGTNEDDSPFSKKKTDSPLGKLEEILGMKKAMECTYIYQDLEGKVYTDGTNMRAESRIRMGETLVDSNTIYTTDYLYTWMANQTTGTKISLKDIDYETNEDSPEKAMPEAPNYFVDIEYTCEEKAIDPTMFNLPEGVEFTELNIPTVDEISGNLDEIDMCAMCENIPLESEKASCKVEFNCN